MYSALKFLSSFFIWLSIVILFGGCTIPAPAPIPLTEEYAFSFEKRYMEEAEQIVAQIDKNRSVEHVVKWIQPSNKKENCKVWTGVTKTNDRTKKDSFKLFWDGGCKDGYAYGLGREIEIHDMFNSQEQVGIYKNGMADGGYCVRKYINDSSVIIVNGECNYEYKAEYTVSITSKKDPKTFNTLLSFNYGVMNVFPNLVVADEPFFGGRRLMKIYPNFAHINYDMSNNEFEDYNVIYSMKNSRFVDDGIAIVIPKANRIIVQDVSNGRVFTSYPQSFIEHISSMYSEILEAEERALVAQEKALTIKQNYLDKICKPNIKVAFMDNDKYKAICTDSEKLKEAFDKNMEMANIQKQQIREQIHRQNMENAAARQAYAAQRQAEIAQQQVFNQQIQNMNQNFNAQQQNFQLQQINNYLRYGF
ncbi:MAG: hypothetical protein LBB59_08600 [Campylobacteraceae bacterium]|jgi:hypothetical protein|nr:hypothetical protein [Campylobacteraceae bacterium]